MVASLYNPGRGIHVRRTKIVYIAMFFMQLGGSVGATGVPLLAKYKFDTSLFVLALIGMAGALSYTVVCLALGPFVSRAKPSALAVAGGLLYAATYLGASLATTPAHLMLVYVGGGAGQALFWPMAEAVLVEGSSGQRLNRRIGLFNITWSMGDSLGAVLAGVLYLAWDRLPFVATIVLMMPVAAAMTVAGRRKADGEEALPSRFEEAGMPRHETRDTNARFRGGAWLGNFIASGATQVMRSVFAAPARDVFLMSSSTLGLVLGTFNAARTLTFWLLREWPDWHYRPRVYMTFNALLAGGMFAVVAAAFLPAPLVMPTVFAAFAASGVGAGMAYYSSIFYAVDGEEVAASTTRLHEAVLGAGGAIAVLVSGVTGKFSAAAAAAAAPALADGPLPVLSPFVMCGIAVSVGMAGTARWFAGPARNGNVLAVPPDAAYPEDK
jgi:hypothetical protein